MANLSDITSELAKMDAASFQQLGEELLRRKYRPKNIISVGLGIRKNTTRKGSPDSIFILPDGKILIEYTIQENRPKTTFLNKLRGDLKSCLNVKKTHVPLSEIKSIVLFSNQLIDVDIYDSLKTELKPYPHIELCIFSINDIAHQLKDYPSLLREYLGIDSFPGLIEIETFVSRPQTKKFNYPIPLDNDYFEFENNSILRGKKALESHDILIISGEAGMGKTRYAIEIAYSFSKSSCANVFVIEEKNRHISDILNNVDTNSTFVFIIDDANRTAIWSEAIQYYKDYSTRNIKIIGTVRSYASKTVIDACASLATVENIQMNEYPENLGSNILSSLNIENPLWHQRIDAVTGKNIRLAVMCAEIAKQKNDYYELTNVEGIYKEYYSSILNDISVGKGDNLLLKVLSIIHFYKVVDLVEDNVLDQIESVFSIGKKEFEETCHTLFMEECVDITEHKVVNIPDQNFGNYVFYICFFEQKYLNLQNLFEQMYHRRGRLGDCIFPGLTCFNKESVKQHLTSSIKEAWKKIEQNIEDPSRIENFLEVFGNIIPNITFRYVYNKIQLLSHGEGMPLPLCSDNILSILSRFSHADMNDMETAINLISEYVTLFPAKEDDAVKVISEHWIYYELDYATSYKRTSDVLDCLIRVSEKNETGFRFASKILPAYLKFVYDFTKMKGRNFTIGKNAVIITDELISIRKRVWNWINANSSKINHVLFLKDLYTDSYLVENIAKELVNGEIPYVKGYVAQLPISSDFLLCQELEHFEKRTNRITGEVSISIDWNQANNLYQLDCLIKKETYEASETWQSHEIKNIKALVESKSHSELFCFLDDINAIQSYKNQDDDRSTYVIESVIECNPNEAFNLWQYCFDKDYELHTSRIISTYIGLQKDVSILVEFIKKQDLNGKSNLILEFVCIVEKPFLYFTDSEFSEAIRHHTCCAFKLYDLVDRFFSPEEALKGYRLVLAAILYRIRKGQATTGTVEFFRNFLKICPKKLSLIEYAYINSLKLNDSQFSYDYKHELLRDILTLNPYFWVSCCKQIPCFVHEYHVKPYEFICKLPNYALIIESTLKYYAEKKWHIPYSEEQNIYGFFYNNKEGASKFIHEMIIKYCHNRCYSNILFDIVVKCMGGNEDFYLTFIKNNDDLEDFKELKLFRREMWGGNSFETAVRARVDFVKSLIARIKSLGQIKFIPHISYLEEKQYEWEKRLQEEIKIGHKSLLYGL